MRFQLFGYGAVTHNHPRDRGGMIRVHEDTARDRGMIRNGVQWWETIGGYPKESYTGQLMAMSLLLKDDAV